MSFTGGVYGILVVVLICWQSAAYCSGTLFQLLYWCYLFAWVSHGLGFGAFSAVCAVLGVGGECFGLL